jgi:cell division protease FtsH
MEVHDKKPGRNPEKRPLYVYYIIVAVIILLLNILVVPSLEERSLKKTDYTTFLESVRAGLVTEATVDDDYIYYVVESGGNQVSCRTVRLEDPNLVERLEAAGVKMEGTVPDSSSLFLSLLLSYLVPIVIFVFLGRWLSKKMMSSMGSGGPGGMMSFGKSNAKV